MGRKKSYNRIVEWEQVDDMIDLLKAYKKVNGDAKVAFYTGFFVSIIVVAILNFLKFYYAESFPSIKYIAAAGALATIAVTFFVNRITGKKKNMAARILQQYEMELYDFPWSSADYGELVPPEDIRLLSENQIDNNYSHWFSHRIAEIDKSYVAITLCQRTCIMYDLKRREYIQGITVTLSVLVVIGSLTLAYIYGDGLTLDFFLYLSVFGPIIFWFINAMVQIKGNIKVVGTLKQQNQTHWEMAIRGKMVTLQDLRLQQNRFFQFRTTQFLIPDFAEFIYRNKLKKDNEYAVGVLVDKYKRKEL